MLREEAASMVSKKFTAMIVWAADAVREVLGSIRRRARKASDDLETLDGKNLCTCSLDGKELIKLVFGREH